MQIARITAKNFRTLEDTTIEFPSNYCTISGKNNAGKSWFVRLITHLLRRQSRFPWMSPNQEIEYEEDVTQWAREKPNIEVKFHISFTDQDDPSLVASLKEHGTEVPLCSENELKIKITIDESGEEELKIAANDCILDETAANKIIGLLRQPNTLLLHNSTTVDQDLFYSRGNNLFPYDQYLFDPDQENKIRMAEKRFKGTINNHASKYASNLKEILRRLSDDLELDVSMPSGLALGRLPLRIDLDDRSVNVSLDAWGGGTQNRTNLLAKINIAHRIRTQDDSSSKITPIVVAEEPESFLHPSAQAEFGVLLQILAEELGVQIIVTTHSPYMLNNTSSSSNILLYREQKRSKSKGTSVVDTSGANWMEPFSEQLGLRPSEFTNWRMAFGGNPERVIFAEGGIDADYFRHIVSMFGELVAVDEDIEIVPYGGKNALQNTAMLAFVLNRIPHALVTVDLDGLSEVRKSFESLGLDDGKDYLAVGVDEDGKRCIEGLVPESIHKHVYAEDPGLVQRVADGDGKVRRAARHELKRKLLEEFKGRTDLKAAELKPFRDLVKAMSKALG